MSDGYLSTDFGNDILVEFFSGTLWVALYATEPGPTGLDGDEFSGGDYERESTTWTTPSGKTTSNEAKCVFDNLPFGTVRWFGIMRTKLGDDIRFAVELDTPIPISASGRLVVPANDIVITL